MSASPALVLPEHPLAELLAGQPIVVEHRPWARHRVDPPTWEILGRLLAVGRLDLLGLWGEPEAVHAALFEPATQVLAVVSLDCPNGRFPSLGRLHPPAIRLERTIRDLFGLEPEGLEDARGWLDHGRWPLRRPLSPKPLPHDGTPDPYPFLPVEGEGIHEIPVGPIHAGIIEPGHFRFSAQGETVVRLEARLGWVHKGIERRLEGLTWQEGARIVGRVSGDATVAYQWAFARAVEAVSGTEPPARAVFLRALMAELERIALHLHDFGFVCNDAAFALVHTHTGILREQLLQLVNELFGHRLMMDRIVPGGVVADLDAAEVDRLRELLRTLARRFERLVRIYDDTPSLMDRTARTGILAPELARRFAAGGHVGRASGRDFDSRRDLAYPPYDELRPNVAVRTRGDVDARVWVRIEEIRESLRLVERILDQLPRGPLSVPVASRAGEGMGIVESFRGEVLVWLRLDAEGRILRCHPRDPSWFQWPLLEAAIDANIVADFPLCNKSFDCSYSGVDL
jgi:Ni,Fe-hydrogenase III large subunit